MPSKPGRREMRASCGTASVNDNKNKPINTIGNKNFSIDNFPNIQKINPREDR